MVGEKVNMKILITGGAGFIGYHLAKSLAQDGHEIIIIDNLLCKLPISTYRLMALGFELSFTDLKIIQSKSYPNLKFIKLDLRNDTKKGFFDSIEFDVIFHLAASTGISNSLEMAADYIDNNILSFNNILQTIKNFEHTKFIYASSSSVYGNSPSPFSEENHNLLPVSFYGITKKTDELMANLYSHSKKLKTVGLRFFTVYGSWGRPDMLIYKLIQHAFKEKEIVIYGKQIKRDFTYIVDVIYFLKLLMTHSENENSKIYNIGSGHPIPILDIVKIIEEKIGKKIKLRIEEKKIFDMEYTFANNSKIRNLSDGYVFTSIENGIENTVDWFLLNKSLW